MKKVAFLICLFSILYNAGFTQENHLTFKGIPIDGSVESFAAKLKQDGYTEKYISDNGAIVLKGQFANEDCEIYLLPTPQTKTIWKVGVIIDTEYTSWISIKTDFNEFKDLLIKKYGVPTYDYHFFSSPYYEGDGYEISALTLDKCHYYTAFVVPEGEISLQLLSSSKITFGYEDKVNSACKTKESEKSALDDI